MPSATAQSASTRNAAITSRCGSRASSAISANVARTSARSTRSPMPRLLPSQLGQRYRILAEVTGPLGVGRDAPACAVVEDQRPDTDRAEQVGAVGGAAHARDELCRGLGAVTRDARQPGRHDRLAVAALVALRMAREHEPGVTRAARGRGG